MNRNFVEKTNIKVDLETLRNDFLKNIKHEKWKIINNRICINTIDGNDNSNFDSSHSLVYAPYEYMIPEFKGTIWEETLNLLPGKKCRARIMIMDSFKTLDLHRDFDRRWHIALFTDPACLMIDFDENKTYHIPSDGYVYDIDTTKLHIALNATNNITRVHLVVSQYV